ncbi:hypothetical protein E2C01_080053 [Portunus trituberculatus]|uniref:Uncharacterized protein n=1 Tax=Portunus trituberculatus TaxID=210409 RepID=A0A5B7IUE5_PORTR|nr:hypothetical protein [Portunus trituberculatus]
MTASPTIPRGTALGKRASQGHTTPPHIHTTDTSSLVVINDPHSCPVQPSPTQSSPVKFIQAL